MNMNLFNILLIVHVIGGTLGLLAGTYIMIAKKGCAKFIGQKLFWHHHFAFCLERDYLCDSRL
ncbi:MAG: hypothetical protein RL329_1190 [Bacteroidota bacterium]